MSKGAVMTGLRLLAVAATIVLAGCFQDSTPAHSDFLPLNDYPTKFLLMRSCRANPAHDNSYQLVLANAVGADAYQSRSTIPEGSVIVAEQHQDPSCTSVVGYYLMAKEKAGYDTAGGDWHWQKLDINQRIQQDGHVAACSSCHARAPCTDFLCSAP